MVCLCVCMSDVISSFESLRAGSQVFALLILFLWVISHTLWSGESLPFALLCLSSISIMFVKKYVGSVYVGRYGGLNEGRRCVFREFCPVCFLVVGESPSALL